jgi:hypothetical protein
MDSGENKKLTSLDGLPRLVGEFRFGETRLKSLEGVPSIGGDKIDLSSLAALTLEPPTPYTPDFRLEQPLKHLVPMARTK